MAMASDEGRMALLHNTNGRGLMWFGCSGHQLCWTRCPIVGVVGSGCVWECGANCKTRRIEAIDGWTAGSAGWAERGVVGNERPTRIVKG
jgi:hypothetical protein